MQVKHLKHCFTCKRVYILGVIGIGCIICAGKDKYRNSMALLFQPTTFLPEKKRAPLSVRISKYESCPPRHSCTLRPVVAKAHSLPFRQGLVLNCAEPNKTLQFLGDQPGFSEVPLYFKCKLPLNYISSTESAKLWERRN